MIKKILVAALILLTSLTFLAQRTNSSPYSYFGIGEEFTSTTVEQSSMGGIGVAFNHYKYLNFTNPAAYSDLRYTTYAFGLLNTDLTAITTDAHIFGGGSIVFEGDTDDSYETTLAITDPTADRTLTLPNLTGTATSITGTQTLANKTFTSPAINAGTLSGAFTGTMDITGTVLSGASPLVFEGATADAHETTLTAAEPTQDNTITIPDSSMTLLTTATHTNQATHIVRCIALG